MNRATRIAAIVFAVTALAIAATASATTVLKLSLKDLAKKSDAIVLARVDDQVSRYEQGKEIYTYYTLHVLEPVKGAKSEQTITIRQLGGVIDNIASVVPGMPRFQNGEEVVVFLTQKDATGYPWVMGLQQGKYSVFLDEKGQKRVRNEASGAEFLSLSGKAAEGAKTVSDMPLQAFLDGIKTDLKESGKVEIDPAPPTE
ncbi:MAG TPA: hypothetical protein VF363_10920 [Candidatus Eisenbacteria bacterium]